MIEEKNILKNQKKKPIKKTLLKKLIMSSLNQNRSSSYITNDFAGASPTGYVQHDEARVQSDQ